MRFQEILLIEGTNYIGMFNDFIGTDNSAKEAVEKYIKWAKATLKKNDRIVWFLRWVRVELAGRVKHTDSQAELARLNRRLKTDYQIYDLVPISNLMTNLSHFMSMSIPQIDSVVWGTQSPKELLDIFQEEEAEWKEANKENNIISYNAGREPKIIMKFKDGYAWFDLEKYYCPQEAKAMGHCGNQPGNRYHTILSLRKLVKTTEGATHWYPVLTFIFNPDTGMLGEMKGRGNEKPVERYHPYIVALLDEYDEIKGIRGGGYLPQNNFKMADLDDEAREALQAKKPYLAHLEEMYAKMGMTKEVLSRVRETLPSGLDSIIYDEAKKRFEVDSWSDFANFINSINDDTVEGLLEIATGENELNDYYEMNAPEAFLLVCDELPLKWQELIIEKGRSRNLNVAAQHLIDANDSMWRLFEQLHSQGSNLRREAWDRLYQYAADGWSFASNHVYTNIPTNDEDDFRNFVESDSTVYLYCDEQDVVNYATVDENGDDGNYDYDLIRMRGDGYDASWDTVDWEYTNELRKDNGLIKRVKHDYKDEWLMGINTQASHLSQDYLAALEGRSGGRIEDPRQMNMKYESIQRLKKLAGLL